MLPGLDDGAENWNAAINMAKQLNDAGFRQVIATPHVFEGREYLSPQTIIAKVQELNVLLKQEGIQVKILPGAENYIFPELARYVKDGKLLTLAGSQYVLMELPAFELPLYTDKVVFELQVAGYIPVLAHPERYEYLAQQPEILFEWMRKGMHTQIDLRSLSGRYGKEARKLAHWMLESNLVQYLGTDIHRSSNDPETYRKECQVLRDLIGDEQFQNISERNPLTLIQGGEVKVQLTEEIWDLPIREDDAYIKRYSRKQGMRIRDLLHKILK